MFRFLKDFFKSVFVFFESFRLLGKHKLWLYLLYPLLLFIGLYALAFLGVNSLTMYLKETFLETEFFQTIPEEGHYFSFLKKMPEGFIGFLFFLVFKIIFWWIGATFLKYITLIFLSPILSLLSEKVEERITGKTFPFSFLQFCKDLIRGLLINIRNMFIEYSLIILFFVVGILFPPSLLVTSPLLLLVSWYFFGFSIIDYSLERHKFTYNESVKYVRKNAGTACGIGFGYWLISTLPSVVGYFFGLTLAPVLAIIGSVVVFVENKKEGKII